MSHFSCITINIVFKRRVTNYHRDYITVGGGGPVLKHLWYMYIRIHPLLIDCITHRCISMFLLIWKLLQSRMSFGYHIQQQLSIYLPACQLASLRTFLQASDWYVNVAQISLHISIRVWCLMSDALSCFLYEFTLIL